MGFNHCYVGNILYLQKELEDVGLEAFVKRYSFYEFISGDTESIDFIEQRAKLWRTTNIDGIQREDQISR
jgi:hypothetical protein